MLAKLTQSPSTGADEEVRVSVSPVSALNVSN